MQIGIFGRVNSGKSTLLNLISGHDVALTSPVAGTTTDVVEKSMELLPLGPVLWIDTPGLDDPSVLAAARRERTQRVFARADAVLLVVEPETWGEPEDQIAAECRTRKIPLIAVVNKCDLSSPGETFIDSISRQTPYVLAVSAIDAGARDAFLDTLKNALASIAGADTPAPALLADLVPSGGILLLVVPIDAEAPKGRIILPQVQTIRAALDIGATAVVVREHELASAMQRLRERPHLVVCDSQAIGTVAATLPADVPLTTFSILFARAKGDLEEAARGAAKIVSLRDGARVLIAEACTHHAMDDDIGRVKIPRWIRGFTGADLAIDVVSGSAYPKELSEYSVVVHCGACTLNRREMQSRIAEARRAEVPITNYGVAISVLHGIASRTLAPFPEALRAYEEQLTSASAAPEGHVSDSNRARTPVRGGRQSTP
jgi:[FeFe] hydrogenase H-cluster maturation GTPase HydF